MQERLTNVGSKGNVLDLPQTLNEGSKVLVEACSIGSRLAREDIDASASERARLERVAEGVEVDDLSTGVVDDVSSALDVRQELGVDEVDRLGKLGYVKRDEVGGRYELLKGIDLTS